MIVDAAKERSLRGIQFLRWIAATFVVVAHVDVSPFAQDASALGFFGVGVDVFFSISGFIMMYLLDTRNDGADIFFARRFIRIFPLYFISTLMVIFLAWLMKLGLIPISVIYHYPPQKLDIDWFLASIFFVNNNRPAINAIGWTLQYEMVFYIVLSLTIFLRVKRQIVFCMLLYAFSVLLSLMGSEALLVGNALFIEFIIGMLIYEWWKSGRFYRVDWSVLFLIAVLTVGGIVLFKNQPQLLAFVSVNYWRVLTAGVAGGGALIITLIVSSRISIKNWMVDAGDYSYSLYLMHWVFIPLICTELIKYYPNNVGVYVLGVLSACHLLSFAIYRFLDRPLTSFLNNFIMRR